MADDAMGTGRKTATMKKDLDKSFINVISLRCPSTLKKNCIVMSFGIRKNEYSVRDELLQEVNEAEDLAVIGTNGMKY